MDDPLDIEQFKTNLLTHLRRLVLKVKAHAEKSAQMYKRYNDRAARPPPNVRKDDQAYVQRPPSYTLAPEEREKNAWRSKLLPKTIRSFRVIAVSGDVVTIDQNGVCHSV